MSKIQKKDGRIRISILAASADLQAHLAKTTHPSIEAKRLMEMGLVMEKLVNAGGLGNGASSTAAGATSSAVINTTAHDKSDPDELTSSVSAQPSTKTGESLIADLGWSADTFRLPGL